MTIISVSSGQVSQPFAAPAGSLVTVTPGSGASVIVEYTTDSLFAAVNGSAAWAAWPNGTIASGTSSDTCSDDVLVRIKSTGGSASVDIISPTERHAPLPYQGSWESLGSVPIASLAQVSGAWPAAYSYVGGKSSLSLLNTRTALAKAQASLLNGNGAGASRGTFLAIGDSTVFGLNSGNVGQYVRRNAWPAYLARILAQAGYGGVASGIFGEGAAGNVNGGDDRLSAGSGWAANAGQVFAQNAWQQSAAGGSLTWTPDAAVDTVDVYYLTFSGLGTFTVDNGGAAFITQNTGAVATATLAKVSATISSSSNPINIKWSSGGAVKILGIRAYTAATTGIDILNAGVNGSTTGGWVTTGAYQYLSLIDDLAPACTFISLGFNDLNTSVPVATYQANLQSLASAAQNGGAGDVVMLIQHPQKVASHTIAQQKAYWDAANAAAVAVGASVVNMPGRWVTGESRAALLSDNTHPNAPGYFDIAKAVADVILGQ